jgi:hypothetical protein
VSFKDLGPELNKAQGDLGVEFHDTRSGESYNSNELGEQPVAKPTETKFPPAVLEDLDEDELQVCAQWLDEQIEQLKTSHSKKMVEFGKYEVAYRALPGTFESTLPFVGASDEVVPVIAMAVDPIHARLDTGIMKQEPVFRVKPLRKQFKDCADALEKWIDFNVKHRWKLRQVMSPRFLEFCKLGTMVLKTVYDREEAPIKRYRQEEGGEFTVVTEKQVRFSGAKVKGVALADVMFPPKRQNAQDCEIIVERLRLSGGQLRVAEASGKITNVKRLRGQETTDANDLSRTQEDLSGHASADWASKEFEIWECWFDYDIDGDGYPEHLVAKYHQSTRTFLELRYNWYFHQRKPYTIMPYMVSAESLYGIGLCEMIMSFQGMITRMERNAFDNSYLANIRMFVAKKNSGIEEVPRIYPGRVFFVEDPSKDFRPFQAGEVYPSTLNERQNLFGMVEKRTGVSDYLTGRESPILGSRATATSTIALINEGTRRVESTLENVRQGMAEVIENALYIWIQYGTEAVEDLIWQGDDTALLIKEFFDQVSEVNVHGGLSVTLSATDANDNKQSRQQMQLAIINIMMQALEKMLSLGQAALMAQEQLPAYTQMAAATMEAGRAMLTDLLKRYDVPDPDAYVPDLMRFLNVASGASAAPGVAAGYGEGGVGGGDQGASLLGSLAGAGGAGRGPGRPVPGAGNGDGGPGFLPSLVG